MGGYSRGASDGLLHAGDCRIPTMLGSFQSLSRLLLMGLLLAQSGCVALNIPSQRWHDPADQGGLFGHHQGGNNHQSGWQEQLPNADSPQLATDSTVFGTDSPMVRQAANRSHGETFTSVEFHGGQGFHGTDGCCDDCDANCFDPLATTEASAPPDIPWPKFHPVPTRPVFGPSGVQ